MHSEKSICYTHLSIIWRCTHLFPWISWDQVQHICLEETCWVGCFCHCRSSIFRSFCCKWGVASHRWREEWQSRLEESKSSNLSRSRRLGLWTHQGLAVIFVDKLKKIWKIGDRVFKSVRVENPWTKLSYSVGKNRVNYQIYASTPFWWQPPSSFSCMKM